MLPNPRTHFGIYKGKPPGREKENWSKSNAASFYEALDQELGK